MSRNLRSILPRSPFRQPLDGGQTGELVFRGEPYNYIDFGMERNVSDILWFATAIPSEAEGALLQ